MIKFDYKSIQKKLNLPPKNLLSIGDIRKVILLNAPGNFLKY
jgi:hypothetical protein